MAATDKHYRDQYTLDMVFALSSILMLVSIVWMFMQDYHREYKDEQRSFRDVEAALAQRAALDQMPDYGQFEKAREAVKRATVYRNKEKLESALAELKSKIAKAREDGAAPAAIADLEANLKVAEARVAVNSDYPPAQAKIALLLPRKETSEQAYQSVKSDLASISSFYDIEVDENGPSSEKAKKYYNRIQELKEKVTLAQAEKDKISAELKEAQVKTDLFEAPLTEAISTLKKVTDKFDVQVRLAISKQWGFGDSVRAFPMIEAFQSPLKIHQFTINDVPIDYNFKYVTRFDRCMTCHMGIDRPAFDRSKHTFWLPPRPRFLPSRAWRPSGP